MIGQIENIFPFTQARRALIGLTIAALASCGGSVPSPSPDTTPITLVTLQGQVTDAATGEPIVGANLAIGSRGATTDNSGRYEITNFPANSGGGVARDYQATITLTSVTSPVKMTDAAITPRYAEKKFAMPLTTSGANGTANHDFKIGKLSASIRGVVGDNNLFPIGGIVVELLDNTPGMAGNLVRMETSTPSKGEFVFSNIEAGVDYKLFARSNDGTLQGNVNTGKITDNQILNLPLGGTPSLILTGTDTYAPRIIKVTPDNNADIAPGTVNVLLTFNEPIKQNSYSLPNPSVLDNIYRDIDVSYGGKKAAGNFVHTLTWNNTFDALTINMPDTGTSSKFTVDLSLISPDTPTGGTPVSAKLKDNAGNGLEKSPVLTSGTRLAFTTNGGAPALAPVILSPDAAVLDWNAKSVILDWLTAPGATKGYNIYRASRDSAGSVEPSVLIAGPVADTTFTDTQAQTKFNLLPRPEVAQSYIYRVTSINSDLIESPPSNELVIKDVIGPTIKTLSAKCVLPGGTSLTATTAVTPTTNGQVQIVFSESLIQAAAETISNYASDKVLAAKLTIPTNVVLDFSSPIACNGTSSILVGAGITDIAGNPLSGGETERTVKF